ncbi:MAG: sugar transferase [Candidatus Kaistia colombiensis]|nr:MAG: sugar transferase [Kaistia sp.]
MDRNPEATANRPTGRAAGAGPGRTERRRRTTGIRQYPFKRSLDLVTATTLILLLLPVGVVIAGLISLGGGPIFFSSTRVGTGGRPFPMYKFRTMVPDAERTLETWLAKDPLARLDYSNRYKLREDPRVTPLGRWLRQFSLDELPQLINVVRGEMSLIGPRPRLPREIADTERYNSRHFEAYYLCRPGMTGLWQVSNRSDANYHARVRLDALYVRQMSLTQDLAILARTVPVVLLGRGEY